MTISAKATVWFENRALSLEAVSQLGIYSGRHERNGDESRVVPDAEGDVLVFPYIEHGKEVAAKYRGRPRADGSKVLWQRVGGRKTFFNSDVLDDPQLADGTSALVIVEGEPDCLAVLTAGYPFVVSVPEGAPPAKRSDGEESDPVPETSDDIDPQTDDKFRFVFNNWDRLKRVKRIVLFTDDDPPGQRLRDELARRLGRVRCSFVTYPAQSGKDANEVLIKLGASAVVAMIANAAPFPIKGIYRLKDFPTTHRPKLVSTGWGRLDTPPRKGLCSLMLAPGFFMVVLGKPGSGKSTWTLQLAHNLATIHGWGVGIASFEVSPIPYVRDILRTHCLQKPRSTWSHAERDRADTYINNRFTFFHIDARVDESEQSLEWLIEKAEEAVIRDGMKAIIIDPWNELEHVRRHGETETQYTARAIRALKKFAMAYEVLVVVVIHPTKAGGDRLASEMSLYDADGSAHWVNKPDIGVVVERDDESSRVILHGRKFRFSFLGAKGATDFTFDPETETFSQ